MTVREKLIEAISDQPEGLLQEDLHYLRFLKLGQEEEAWSDVLPGREIEQEVLDIIDAAQPR